MLRSSPRLALYRSFNRVFPDERLPDKSDFSQGQKKYDAARVVPDILPLDRRAKAGGLTQFDAEPQACQGRAV